MLIGFPKENDLSELRIAILPEVVKKYVKLGLKVGIEADRAKTIFILKRSQ